MYYISRKGTRVPVLCGYCRGEQFLRVLSIQKKKFLRVLKREILRTVNLTVFQIFYELVMIYIFFNIYIYIFYCPQGQIFYQHQLTLSIDIGSSRGGVSRCSLGIVGLEIINWEENEMFVESLLINWEENEIFAFKTLYLYIAKYINFVVH